MRLSGASRYVLAAAVATSTCCSAFAPKVDGYLASNYNAAQTPLTAAATSSTALSMGLRSFVKRKLGKGESGNDSSEGKKNKKGTEDSRFDDSSKGNSSEEGTDDSSDSASTADDNKSNSHQPIQDISSDVPVPSHPTMMTQSGSLVMNTVMETSVSDAELDRLFNKYDTDSNGSINKEEFRAVADKMRASSSRREALSVAAASFGSIFVANGSNTFQWGQKQFRSKYIEQDAEFSQQLVFPTAILSGDADRAVAKTLRERGFTPQNTLFAHSICSDEVNNRAEQLVPLMSRRWGEAFTLGGLAGLPFAGKSGFSAYFHHVPENGKLLIMFAPHGGIGPLGRIGALQRDGQDSISSACGAAVGAYKALQKKKAAPVDPVTVLDLLKDEDTAVDFDPQLKTIVDLLKPRLEGIEESTDSIAFVTYQMYGIIRELLYGILDQSPDLFETCSEGTFCRVCAACGRNSQSTLFSQFPLIID